jgi:hypothetical protein
MYEYAPVIGELEKMQKDPSGGRPFHKVGENDDVSDSLAGVVSRCYNVDSLRTRKGDLKKDRVSISKGSRGPLVISVNEDHNQEEIRIKN